MEERTDGGTAGRWLRRERRRKAQRERLQKHGASLKRVYAAAIRKRAQASKS